MRDGAEARDRDTLWERARRALEELARETPELFLQEVQGRLTGMLVGDPARGSGVSVADLLEALGRAPGAVPGPTGPARGGPYRVLGLDPSAPDELVRLAYRHLARQHHPDRGGDTARMAEVNRAYEEIARLRGWKP